MSVSTMTRMRCFWIRWVDDGEGQRVRQCILVRRWRDGERMTTGRLQSSHVALGKSS